MSNKIETKLQSIYNTLNSTRLNLSVAKRGIGEAIASRGILFGIDYSTVGTSCTFEQYANIIRTINACVDMGLPSGNNWLKFNIGAQTEMGIGLYFAWGDTTGYTAEQITSNLFATDFSNYKLKDDTRYGDIIQVPSPDPQYTVLTNEDDAVVQSIYNKFCIPTADDWKELFVNTNKQLVDTGGNAIGSVITSSSTWGTWSSNQNNFGGIKFINRNDSSKYIILPTTGYAQDGVIVGAYPSATTSSADTFYWSSTVFKSADGGRRAAYAPRFNGQSISGANQNLRCTGLNIRGIYKHS